VAVAAGLVGAFALWRGLDVFAQDKVADLSPWLGAMIKQPAKYPTYEYYIGHIAHSCAPWSAFVPFALGRMFIAPVGRTGAIARRETDARVAIMVGAALMFVLHGWLAARTDLIPFAGVALLAAACGVAIRDFERGAHPSAAVGVGTLVFLGLLHHDFHELPDKAYQAFGVVGPAFPESFKPHALLLWTVALIGFAGLGLILWTERDAKRTPFDPAEYLKILQALRDAWDGLLALGFFALVAGFSLGALAIWIGVKTHGAWLPTLSLQVRDALLNAWWVTAFVPLGAIFGVFFACDVMLWTFGRANPFTTASYTRGFEPFENLYGQLRGETKPATVVKETELGELKAAEVLEPRPNDERLVALFILLPLMVLALPAGTMALLIDHGTKPFVAASVAIPSGVALFLALGVIGDALHGRRAAFYPVVAEGGLRELPAGAQGGRAARPLRRRWPHRRVLRRRAAGAAARRRRRLPVAHGRRAGESSLPGDEERRALEAQHDVPRARRAAHEPPGARRALQPDSPRRLEARAGREGREPARQDHPLVRAAPAAQARRQPRGQAAGARL
jgi:hypothetical protein